MNKYTQIPKVTFKAVSNDDLGLDIKQSLGSTYLSPMYSQINDLCMMLRTKNPPKCLGYLDGTCWRHTVSYDQQSMASPSSDAAQICDFLGGQGSVAAAPSTRPGVGIKQG